LNPLLKKIEGEIESETQSRQGVYLESLPLVELRSCNFPLAIGLRRKNV